jgi:hypothetical protein
MGENFLTDGFDVAMHADLGWLAFPEVKVGAFDFNELLEKGVDLGHGNYFMNFSKSFLLSARS